MDGPRNSGDPLGLKEAWKKRITFTTFVQHGHVHECSECKALVLDKEGHLEWHAENQSQHLFGGF